MRRSYLFILLLCALMFAVADVALAAFYDEHTGDSWDDAYIIDSAEDFQEMRERNLSPYNDNWRGKYFKLTSNISVTLTDYSRYNTYIRQFEGYFDGQGYTINVSFENPDGEAALFRGVYVQDSSDVVIKNLNVTGTVKGKYEAAGIISSASRGTIENCSFNGTIEVNGDTVNDIIAGGIVRFANDDVVIKNCKFDGTIRLIGSGLTGGGIAGGIAGVIYTNATIDSCTVSSGAIIYISEPDGVAGGIVGTIEGKTKSSTIQNCTSEASITATYAGGILGYDDYYNNTQNLTPVKLINNTYPSQYPEVGNSGAAVTPTPTPTPTPEPVTPTPTPEPTPVLIDLTLDSDNDGLPDVWEIYGLDLDGDGNVDVDLPAMGADPNVPDIFVEVDYMYKPGENTTLGTSSGTSSATVGEINLKPSDKAMKIVMEQFARKRPAFPNGINLHIDTGPDSIMDLKTGKKWGSRSRSNTIDYVDIIDLGANRENWELSENNFNKARWNTFRHCIVINRFDSEDYTGLAKNIPEQFFLVADLENQVLKDDRATAGTFMHELGHTLGLHHGGNDDTNFKPNYLSVMNYLYVNSGLIASSANKTNYSEYVLASIDERAVNEEHGIDRDSVTKNISGVRWELPSNSNSYGYETFEVREYFSSIAGAWLDFNWNSQKDTNAAIDFYLQRLDENGKLPNLSTDVIPESINDWEHLILKAGMIGDVNYRYITFRVGAVDSGDNKTPFSISNTSNAVQEIPLKELEEVGLLHNPGDCEVSSVMPDVLYTGVNNQKIKVKVRNMFDIETTAHLEITSDLLASPYSSDIEFAASADKTIELAVPSSALTAGKHSLTYTLTCANEEVKSGTVEIAVQAVDPIVLKAGESETLTGTAVGLYELSVEDETIAVIEGSTIYAAEPGKTFIILQDLDSGRTVCTIPIYVTETGELDPEDTADDDTDTDSDPSAPTEPTDPIGDDDNTTDPTAPSNAATSRKGSSGCNAGFEILCVIALAALTFKRRVNF